MRRFLLALLILGALGGVILLIGMAQNEGCLPWKERVGARGDTFAEIEGNTCCR